MKTNKFLQAMFLGAMVVGVQSFAQDTHSLEYKFAKGKTYLFSLVSSSNVTQEMGGQEMKFAQGSSFTIRTFVDDLKNGTMVLIMSADSAVSSSKSAMRDTTMTLTNMIGKRLKITVSKLGDVLKREILDSVVLAGQMRGGGQREIVGFLTLPEKPVKIGDKWTTTKTDTVEQMGGKIFNTTQYEFTLAGKEQKIGHDCVKILYTGKFSVNGNMKMQGMELFVEGGGKISGTFYFDSGKGLPVIVESITDQETTMAATGQQQMTIPISSSTKSTTTLIQE